MEILDFDEFSMRLEKLTVLGAKNPNADWNLRSNYSYINQLLNQNQPTSW